MIRNFCITIFKPMSYYALQIVNYESLINQFDLLVKKKPIRSSQCVTRILGKFALPHRTSSNKRAYFSCCLAL